MYTTHSNHSFPDLYSKPSAHRFNGTWDSIAVARIILQNSAIGKSPAFLYLGREESDLLKKYLGDAFGEESVTTLHDTYHMGLKVISVDRESYICTGGSKTADILQTPAFRIAS